MQMLLSAVFFFLYVSLSEGWILQSRDLNTCPPLYATRREWIASSAAAVLGFPLVTSAKEELLPESSPTQSTNNDPLASFGQELQQNNQHWPQSSPHPLPTISTTQSDMEAAIAASRSKKQVGPRTHG